MIEERIKKWKIYKEAVDWVSPVPSWFEVDNKYRVNDFVNKFQITLEEAQRLVDRLVEEKKLEKTDEDGVYKSVLICDMCGNHFDDWDLQENHKYKFSFGFGSRHDLEIIKWNLCAACFDKVIDTILPLFPKSPISQADLYNDVSKHESFIMSAYEHDNDPF